MSIEILLLCSIEKERSEKKERTLLISARYEEVYTLEDHVFFPKLQHMLKHRE